MGEPKRDTGLARLAAVISITIVLAAGLPPLLAGNFEGARIAQADQWARQIADAVGRFHDDLGRWPTLDAKGGETVVALLSGDAARAQRVDVSTREGGVLAPADYLANHLIYNRTQGGGYPVKGERAWRGPYLEQAPLDPWGHPYVIHLGAVFPNNRHTSAVVVSGGPNGVVETPQLSRNGSRFGGDDIGIAFFVR